MLLNFSTDESTLNRKKKEGLSITEIIDMSKSINSDWIQREAEKKIPEKQKNKGKSHPTEENR